MKLISNQDYQKFSIRFFQDKPHLSFEIEDLINLPSGFYPFNLKKEEYVDRNTSKIKLLNNEFDIEINHYNKFTSEMVLKTPKSDLILKKYFLNSSYVRNTDKSFLNNNPYFNRGQFIFYNVGSVN